MTESRYIGVPRLLCRHPLSSKYRSRCVTLILWNGRKMRRLNNDDTPAMPSM